MSHDSHLNQLDDLKVAIILSNHDEWRNRREEVLRMVQDPDREVYVRELLSKVVTLPSGFPAVAARTSASSSAKLWIGLAFTAALFSVLGAFVGGAIASRQAPREDAAQDSPSNEDSPKQPSPLSPNPASPAPQSPDTGVPVTGSPPTGAPPTGSPPTGAPKNVEPAMTALQIQLAKDLEEIQGAWEWRGEQYRMVKTTKGNVSTIQWFRADGELYQEHRTELVLARVGDKRFLAFSMEFTFGSRKGNTFSDAYRYDVKGGIFYEYGGGKPKQWRKVEPNLN